MLKIKKSSLSGCIFLRLSFLLLSMPLLVVGSYLASNEAHANTIGLSASAAATSTIKSTTTKSNVLLPAPTAVVPTMGDRLVLISWRAVKGAKSYYVYWSKNKGVNKSTGNKIKLTSTAFEHRKLDNGTIYYYIVTAINADGESAASTEVFVTPQQPVPAAPSGVNAVQFDGKIKISWNSVKSATSYNIYYSEEKSSEGKSSEEKNVTQSSGTRLPAVSLPYTHNSLINGKTYYYVVTALNSGGESAISAQTSSVPQVAVRAAPTNFAAAADDGAVKLSWQKVAGATSYNVYWSAKAGVTIKTAKKLENLSSGSLLTGLINGTRLYYVVTAFNEAGESALSTEISTVPQVAVPATPGNFRAIPEDARVLLRWQAVAGASSYNLYWSSHKGVNASSGTIIRNLKGTEFAHLKLKNGLPYFYVLTSVNEGGESALSVEVSAVPQISAPAVPTNISIVPGNTEVTLNWTLIPDATSYNVYWSAVSGVSKRSGKKITNVKPNQILSKLKNGTKHFYIVTAVNAGGESAGSIEIVVIPQVPAPAVPVGTSVIPADTKVSIAWEKVSGATSYNLYWSKKPGVKKATAEILRNIKLNDVQSKLTNGTRYYYAIAAVNAGGESGLSNEVSVIPQVPAPAAPVNITATIADKRIALNWKDSAGNKKGTTSFNIFWNQSGNVTSKDNVIKNVSPPYTHKGLKNGETYYYIVSARNAGGETVSQIINAILLPDAPVFSSSIGGKENIILKWDEVKHAKSYTIYWANVANVNSSSNKLANVSSPYTHEKLTNGLTYHYVVTANNGSGEAVSKETVVTLAPDAPAIAALTGGFEQVGLDVKETIGATQYHIYWNTTGDVSKKDKKIKNISVKRKILKLKNGTTYYYRISAENAGGEGPLSVEANVTLAPDLPTIEKADTTENSITLNWKPMPGATAYNIYWNTTGTVTKDSNKITNTEKFKVTSPFEHVSLIKGSTYYYAVSALNKGGESKLSAVFKVTLAPDTPKILPLKGGKNEVTLTWTAMHGATSYNIYWANEADVTLKSKKLENVYSAKIKDAAPTYIHSKIPNGIKYYYRITAVNAGGESPFSIEDSITLAPDAPVIISSTGADKIVTLIWKSVKHVDSYTIHWGVDKGISSKNERVINAVSPYTFYQLENRRPYYFAMTANNAGGASILSSEVSVTPHNKPLNGMFDDVGLQRCIDEVAQPKKWLYADQIVGTVYCGSNRIKNLSGIEFLVNINKLSLKNNSISDVEPLSSLTKLTSLSLDSNNISDVSALASLTKLTTLHLHRNSISDVSALSSLTKLNYLSLYKNSVENISALSSLRQLTSLYLNSNKILDVGPLATLVNLKFLDLGRNFIGGKGVGHIDLLTSLVQADNIHLIRNRDISCEALKTLINTMGSPPVDTDGIASNFDVAVEGENCTAP